MATVKFMIDTIDHWFGKTDQIHDYFQLQHDLLEKGHTIQYHSNSGEVETIIKDKEHFYNFIRSFKFLPTEEIIKRL
ncbi:MAG: hypothetical protein OQJ96_12870 [Flavobacteriales bacterium]|nr:hypothetical protein [Flavobacteriales bacterium]MCW8912879.1 hypothetical protein [Flavobacteriales bacterium]MCW8937228.1 hypothetical protein [Flavobacteriales bacterium]MCW8939381.1 hypothetical protein [Flavobacteriales bacterium]MCW8967811.1 hypothetical protein [Flavobacteriales bacterium]